MASSTPFLRIKAADVRGVLQFGENLELKNDAAERRSIMTRKQLQATGEISDRQVRQNEKHVPGLNSSTYLYIRFHCREIMKHLETPASPAFLMLLRSSLS